MSDLTRWAGEAIGVVGLLWLIMFIGTYARHAYWRKTPEGRSVMYLAVGLAGTILLLIIHGLTGAYTGRWAVEVLVFSALAVACWNLHYTLRRSLGLKVAFLFLVRRKPRPQGEAMTTQPVTTQQAHPWRAAARTAVAVLAGVASTIPLIVLILDEELNTWGDLAGPGAQAVAVATIVTRIMALPVVDRMLAHIGLGSSPAVKPHA